MSFCKKLATNLEEIRARIKSASNTSGRDARDITLIAVSKLQPIEKIYCAHDLGIMDFGENTAQNLASRVEAFAKAGRTARWHFIGRLQRNKVATVFQLASVIHSIDRPELLVALARHANPKSPKDILLQVNISNEPQKGGVLPENTLALAKEATQIPGIHLKGLMGIAKEGEDPTPYFARLAALSRQLIATKEGAAAHAISMGMSQDFEIAIEQGATMVRVGTSLFGHRVGANPGVCPGDSGFKT